ncbi:MAG: hypothetical protein ACI8VC_001883 [Candidatus Endobugula sp.]|jgi:hypothetical protein
MSIEGESIIKGAFKALEFAAQGKNEFHQLKREPFKTSKFCKSTKHYLKSST